MTIDHYFEELSQQLQILSDAERDDVLAFYHEFAEDAQLTDYSAMEAKLGSPKQLARKVLADYSVQQNQEVTKTGKKSSAKSNASMIWMIVLAILSAPISIPLVIIAAAIIFSILVIAFSIIVTIGVTLAALIVTMAALAVFGLYVAGFMIFKNVAVGIASLGLGCVALGITLLLVPVIRYSVKGLIHLTASFFRWLYSKFMKRQRFAGMKGAVK